jgi:dTMP kinase
MSHYIAIEGGDGSGKSTITTALEERLVALGHSVLVVREPGSTELGEEIRRLLLDGSEMTPWAEAFLFAAQRAQLAVEHVAPALEAGTWVVSDRTYYSSIAYQGGARGLGLEKVRQINEAGLEGVEPDLVFVLDLDVELALERQAQPDRIGGEQHHFHQAVRDAYLAMAADEPDRVFLIDNSAGTNTVVDSIMSRIL